MAKKHELISLRVDDIPLIYEVVRSLNIGAAVNQHYIPHGNWVGVSPGDILELWLCYMLSVCDHRLSPVEKWAEARMELLRAMSGLEELNSYDFSDDKLGDLLIVFAADDLWSKIETTVNSQGLSVYRFEVPQALNTFRLDAAPMQSYGSTQSEGLLQYGYHKHHGNLPQFKVKLCTLDNEVNNFAYPICHLTVEGNLSDDALYQSILSKNKEVLSGVQGYSGINLYVGDKKFGSIGNRTYVVAQQDCYLLPLSLVQLSSAARRAVIEEIAVTDYELIYKEEKGVKKLVAQGFEQVRTQQGSIEQTDYTWSERQLYIHSVSYAKSQQAALDRNLEKAKEQIAALNISKQGKRISRTEQECRDSIDNILKTNKVEGLVSSEITVNKQEKEIRAYGKRPARTVIELNFEIGYELKSKAIEDYKKLLGWQVYATNAPTDLLSFESCVWKYRHQSNIESRFDDLRNKIVPLLPVFLHMDERIKGLVNVLLTALKVCTMIEYQTAKKLQENQEQLKRVFEGNPKRGTDRPSATRIFNAFDNISISLIFEERQLKLALMTDLEPVQLKILELLGLKPEIYTDLTQKIQMFFSNSHLTEI